MAHAVKIIYTIEDDKGKQATCFVQLPTNLLLADYIEFAEEMGDLINNITVGAIVNVGIAFTVDISGYGWAASPGATSDIEEKGYFQFRTAGGFFTGIKIPALSDLLVVGGSDLLDETEADISDFIDAMEDGIVLPVLTTLVKPSDSREDDITLKVFAREVFRASGKRA